ncbi:MAG: hypothetical protein R3C32_06540 [Chloroflexota bacterium]
MLTDIRLIGQAVGAPDAADALTTDMAADLDRIAGAGCSDRCPSALLRDGRPARNFTRSRLARSRRTSWSGPGARRSRRATPNVWSMPIERLVAAVIRGQPPG